MELADLNGGSCFFVGGEEQSVQIFRKFFILVRIIGRETERAGTSVGYLSEFDRTFGRIGRYPYITHGQLRVSGGLEADIGELTFICP